MSVASRCLSPHLPQLDVCWAQAGHDVAQLDGALDLIVLQLACRRVQTHTCVMIFYKECKDQRMGQLHSIVIRPRRTPQAHTRTETQLPGSRNHTAAAQAPHQALEQKAAAAAGNNCTLSHAITYTSLRTTAITHKLSDTFQAGVTWHNTSNI